MTDTLHQLVEALQQPALFPHPVTRFKRIETHISIVLLTGPYAYKFKKPVDFGFLDFSTLARRKHFCEEELRLNRRLAPELYCDVIPVTTGPALDGDGEVLEYAVRMREFDQATQFDRLLDSGRLAPEHIDALGQRIAQFHAAAAIAGPESDLGAPPAIQAPAEENFTQILACTGETPERPRLEALQAWTRDTFQTRLADFRARKHNGFIRECHGDLHLRNIALIHDAPVAFDCIEFNDRLRWIDTLSEVAFMVMDLDHRGQTGLASRFLNVWLEQTGDYAGLVLLRYYTVYRAMVRAKVDCLRAHQADIDRATREAILGDYRAYVALAEHYTQRHPPTLLLMHGLSGSGKTYVSQALLERLPAIRLRSDIERKRLHGLAADARTATGIDSGLYSHGASERTYQHLKTLAGTLLDAGMTVIVDATFLEHERLKTFISLANDHSARCFVIDCQATEAQLRKRISARNHSKRDASEADIEVLENQLRHYQPLEPSIAGAEVLVTQSDETSIIQLLKELQSRDASGTQL